MSTRKSMHGLAVVILALSAAGATADELTGFYAGAGIGPATFKNAPIRSAPIDDRDTAFKVFAGYSFGPLLSDDELLSIELAYIDSGTAERIDRLTVANNAGLVQEQRLTAEAKIVNLSLVGMLPLSDSFAVFAKVGYASVDLETTSTSQALGRPNFRSMIRNRDEELSYGGGISYSFTRSFQARAEYEGFDVDDADLNFISLSAIYKFY